jgi:aerobic carbon-monoxide dehydrogenase medium subunit
VILDRFTLLRPESLADALRLAEQHGDAVLLAGGQSLLPAMKAGRSRPAVVLDLGPLGGAGGALRYIRGGEGRVVIGAMTRHADIERSALLRQTLPLLARAVSTVGDPQVRHRGTIGGSLAYGDPAADAAVALTALRADLVIEGPGGRRVTAIDDFLGRSGLRAAEIITEIQVPPAAGAPWGFAKFRRKSFEWAIVSAAYQGSGPGVPVPGIALANMAPVTVRAVTAERAAAAGAPLPEIARLADADSHPQADVRATVEFRRHLSRVLLERAMLDALSGAPVRWTSSPVVAHS